jgi:hypothetical protein
MRHIASCRWLGVGRYPADEVPQLVNAPVGTSRAPPCLTAHTRLIGTRQGEGSWTGVKPIDRCPPTGACRSGASRSSDTRQWTTKLRVACGRAMGTTPYQNFMPRPLPQIVPASYLLGIGLFPPRKETSRRPSSLGAATPGGSGANSMPPLPPAFAPAPLVPNIAVLLGSHNA